MGLFDLFGRTPKQENTAQNKPKFNMDEFTTRSVDNSPKTNGPVVVYSPQAYADVEVIIDSLKQGNNAVVHLNELKTETAIRVLDMLSGAIYALGGGVYEMEKNIFMFSPCGIEVK